MPYISMSSPAAPRHIRERAVATVAVKTQRGPLPLVPGPVHGVDQQNVLPAVGVVVEKRTAGTERLGKQFAAVCTAVVLKENARLGRDVGEPEAERWRRATKRGVCSQSIRRRRPRRQPCAGRAYKEFPPPHGKFTRPFRIAYTTNSAVL